MDHLDNFTQEQTGPAPSYWPTVIRFAVIGCMALFVYFLLTVVLDINVGSISAGLITLALTITAYAIVSFLAVKHHRDANLAGYISFGSAFQVAFFTTLLAGIGYQVLNLLYNFLDPGYLEDLVERTVEYYEDQGFSEAQLEAMEASMANPFSPTTVAIGLFVGLALACVIGLMVAAFMKKDKPQITS